MKKIEPPIATSGSGKILVPPPQPTKDLVTPVGRKNPKGIPAWILIAAGVGLLVVLSIIAFVIVSGNVGTTPKKGTPRSSGDIHDTSMLEPRSDDGDAAFTS